MPKSKHTRFNPRTMNLSFAKKFSFACLLSLVAGATLAQDASVDDVLRKTPTPFGPPVAAGKTESAKTDMNLSMPAGAMKLEMSPALDASPEEKKQLTPIAISRLSSRLSLSSLSERLVSAKIYLPDHMVLGKDVQFTVRGKPGQLVALAMADKDTGASPIYGHKLRLGSDRKVVAIGEIDAEGSVKLTVTTPIQGDLVGQYLYFEAALWTKPDFSDVVLATPVALSDQKDLVNGVLVSEEGSKGKRLHFMPAPTNLKPIGQGSDPMDMNSGQP